MRTYFEQNCMPGYAVETLINGNITECANHIAGMMLNNEIGVMYGHEELMKVKEGCPEKYQLINKMVHARLIEDWHKTYQQKARPLSQRK